MQANGLKEYENVLEKAWYLNFVTLSIAQWSLVSLALQLCSEQLHAKVEKNLMLLHC